MYDKLKFRVRVVELNPGETVCVSGDCEDLGDWSLGRVLPLQKLHDGSAEDIWTGSIPIPKQDQVAYRYVICMILHEPCRQVIVRRWETSLEPRRKIINNVQHDEVNQDCFGYIDGTTYRVQSGWMTAESIIQLKLYNNPIQIWKRRYTNKIFQIKVTAIDLRRHDSESMVDDDSTMDNLQEDSQAGTWPIVELAVMNETEHEFALQSQFGRAYSLDEFLVFQVQVLNLETTAYMVDFYIHNAHHQETDIPERVGFCYILPSVFCETTGVSIVPITGVKHHPIGQLTVEYLVIRPMRNHDCDLSVTYSNHWKRNRKTLEVGHRGAGSSFNTTQHCANIRENTVTSLKHAANHGADYVEFDVQVSKDLVPIIYHDFHVCICTKKKYSGDDSELLVLPVQDLTFPQLQSLKLQHVTELMVNETTSWNFTANPREFMHDDHEDSQPFPTLKQVLDAVDIHVGFNVEIKWNLQRKDGTRELSYPMEINLYLDTILKVLLQNARNRRIIISCFNPDICTMLRLKQNKYPVLFLTQGQSKKYPPYLDPRTSSIQMALHYARSAGILGIDVHTEDILEDHSLVQLCKQTNLVMFCWGEDNNDPKVITTLKNLGLDGVIYDRIDEHKTEKENMFLMETKERKALLESAGVICEGMSGNGSVSLDCPRL